MHCCTCKYWKDPHWTEKGSLCGTCKNEKSENYNKETRWKKRCDEWAENNIQKED